MSIQSDNISFRYLTCSITFVLMVTGHRQFDLNANLQAVAVSVTLSEKVTICSIYLPPSDILSKNSLVNLINQLPQQFMLVGDFNGPSKV